MILYQFFGIEFQCRKVFNFSKKPLSFGYLKFYLGQRLQITENVLIVANCNAICFYYFPASKVERGSI